MTNINDHNLVPKQKLLSKEDKKKVLEQYKVSARSLPKIFADDPAIAELDAKPGDVVEVSRESRSAGKAVYYRVVVQR